MDEDEPAVVVCCQGPPICELRGEEAQEAQENGCIWCKYLYVYADGKEEKHDPCERSH